MVNLVSFLALTGWETLTLDFDDKNYLFAVFPNTTYMFNDEAEIVKEAPFNYPYAQITFVLYWP
jgi:hypothetical protein